MRFEQNTALAQCLRVRKRKKPHTRTPRKRATQPPACTSRMNFTTAQDDRLETMPGPRPMNQARRPFSGGGGPKLQPPTKQQDPSPAFFKMRKTQLPVPRTPPSFSGTHAVSKMMTRSQWESPIAPFRVGTRGVLRFKQSGERTKGRWRFPNYGIAPCCRFSP